MVSREIHSYLTEHLSNIEHRVTREDCYWLSQRVASFVMVSVCTCTSAVSLIWSHCCCSHSCSFINVHLLHTCNIVSCFEEKALCLHGRCACGSGLIPKTLYSMCLLNCHLDSQVDIHWILKYLYTQCMRFSVHAIAIYSLLLRFNFVSRFVLLQLAIAMSCSYTFTLEFPIIQSTDRNNESFVG